jgi:hypothetical protein
MVEDKLIEDLTVLVNVPDVIQAKFDEKRGLYIGRWNFKVSPEGIKTNGIFSLKEL